LLLALVIGLVAYGLKDADRRDRLRKLFNLTSSGTNTYRYKAVAMNNNYDTGDTNTNTLLMDDSEEDSDEEEDVLDFSSILMIKPNNIPCEGFHKEVVRRTDNTSRVDMYIFTPTYLTEKHSSLKKKLRSASDVKKYFKETKKLGITFPKTCTIAKFTKFKTKVSDLDEKERMLLRAAAFIVQKVPILQEEGEEEEDIEEKIKKIKDKINNKILEEAHPEILNINNTEMMTLSKCIRNKSGSIIDI
jgi:hypothetical protein